MQLFAADVYSTTETQIHIKSFLIWNTCILWEHALGTNLRVCSTFLVTLTKEKSDPE